MRKRSSKPRQEDMNETSYRVVQEAIAKADPESAANGKNPAAVALGHLGGLKGGKARAERLSAKRRAEIAKRAAQARWGKGKKPARTHYPRFF
jgi:hypothetical protein